MKKIIHVIFKVIISFICMISSVIPVHWQIEAEEQPGRAIYVVYDDSQSMADLACDADHPGQMLKRWSQAKYAMEVFTAMMDPNDVMRIYPMSDFGDKYIEIKEGK